MKVKISNDKLKITLFCLFIYATIIVDVFRIVNNSFFHMGDGVTTLFRNAVYIMLFTLMLFTFIKDKKSLIKFVVICFGYIVVVLISFAVNNELEILIRNSVLLFFSRIAPAFIIASAVDDYGEALNRITKWRWLVLVYIFLFVTVGMSGERYYYMYVGYNLLYPTLILLFTNEKKKILDKAIAIAAILVILLFCSRGAALVLIPSVVLFYLVQTLQIGNIYKRFIVIGVLVIAGLLLMVFLNDFFEYLYRMFPDSRTLYYIMHGDIMDSSGRDNYYSLGIKEILNHPFIIRGILGDRFFYGHIFGMTDIEGAFAHNFFLEVMLQYGFVIGLVISGLFLMTVIKGCVVGFKMNNISLTVVLCAIVIPSFLISMTTASYLSTIETAIMLGVCTSIIRQGKIKKGRKKREKNDVTRWISTADHSY